MAAMQAYNAYQGTQDGGGSNVPAGNENPYSDLLAFNEGGGGGGAPLPPPPQPVAATSISPNIQTSITPQISPVFTQISDSAGAMVAASPVQTATGGQRARGGEATASPVPTVPPPPFPIGSGGLPVQPMTSPTFRDEIRTYDTAADEIAKMQAALPFNWTPVIWGVGVVGALGLAYNIWGKKQPAAAA